MSHSRARIQHWKSSAFCAIIAGMDGCAPAQLRSASLIAYVNSDTPPMLLIVGDADTTVPYLQTVQMAKELEAVHVEPETHRVPRYHHSFLGTTLAATRAANQKALHATIRFVDKQIGAPTR